MSHVTATSRRPSGLRRGVPAVAVTLLAGGAFAAPAQGAAPKVPERQALVVLEHDRVAHSRPSTEARRIRTVAARRPLTRVRTVLPVIGRTAGKGGRTWLRVRLPGRPNGHTGWIRALQVRRTATAWHLVVDLSERRVSAYRDGRVVRRFGAVVGTPATPTPRGTFFVEEALSLSSQASGGPFALATSARSEVLQEFNGGPGQIALHGTNLLSDPLGSAASHGCIRLSTRAITWLVQRIDRGIPLTVRG